MGADGSESPDAREQLLKPAKAAREVGILVVKTVFLAFLCGGVLLTLLAPFLAVFARA